MSDSAAYTSLQPIPYLLTLTLRHNLVRLMVRYRQPQPSKATSKLGTSVDGNVGAATFKTFEGQRVCKIREGDSPDGLRPVRVWTVGRIQEFWVVRGGYLHLRDCQATMFRRNIRCICHRLNGIRLDVDSIAAIVGALHGGSVGTSESHVSPGVADAADLEGLAGDFPPSVTCTLWSCPVPEMCTHRGTSSLGADEAQDRHNRRDNVCEALHRGISFSGRETELQIILVTGGRYV